MEREAARYKGHSIRNSKEKKKRKKNPYKIHRRGASQTAPDTALRAYSELNMWASHLPAWNWPMHRPQGSGEGTEPNFGPIIFKKTAGGGGQSAARAAGGLGGHRKTNSL